MNESDRNSETHGQSIIVVGGQSNDGLLDDVQDVRLDFNQKQEEQKTTLKFRCHAQNFDINAHSTVALVQDGQNKLHWVRYNFADRSYKAKGTLEIMQTVDPLLSVKPR